MSRLPAHPAQRIDRTRSVTFSFAGRTMPALDGDTVGSALAAAGVRMSAEASSLTGPRGLLCCAWALPELPRQRRRHSERSGLRGPASAGMRVRPSTRGRRSSATAGGARSRSTGCCPVGFYYKTFIQPRAPLADLRARAEQAGRARADRCPERAARRLRAGARLRRRRGRRRRRRPGWPRRSRRRGRGHGSCSSTTSRRSAGRLRCGPAARRTGAGLGGRGRSWPPRWRPTDRIRVLARRDGLRALRGRPARRGPGDRARRFVKLGRTRSWSPPAPSSTRWSSRTTTCPASCSAAPAQRLIALYGVAPAGRRWCRRERRPWPRAGARPARRRGRAHGGRSTRGRRRADSPAAAALRAAGVRSSRRADRLAARGRGHVTARRDRRRRPGRGRARGLV